ncbi:PREDICTED: uncharacterized protein LOC104720618 [Camelina sativa]|uniref:Uncharacterized protein LOC104720618 n=1 Tax=Camelina sativa TaxID=90675 RepID=A0ABM0U6S7_CAMSA|nr:PREDICTED: uncharacterized protein LOC104720618 [Camelina sativa]
MTSHGALFTWCNKRANDLILKKQDRVIVNTAWEHFFPQSYNVFAAGGCSDHLRCRLMVHGEAGPIAKCRPFKFLNLLTEIEEFMPLVGDYWEETKPMSTSTLFCFSKKLKGLKPRLKSLAKTRMGNLIRNTKEAFNTLCQKQHTTLFHPLSHAMDEEKEAYKRWDFLAGLEERYLKQKSKLHWFQVGDRNNKTFHKAAKAREARNNIREVQCLVVWQW